MKDIVLIDGICNECVEFEKIKNVLGQKDVLAMAFEKIVNNCREVGKEHDVVVGLSGGTDSTYMLFMLTTKYKLRVKAITFDNGYLSEQARNNINNTVEILKIEHEYIEFDENFRRETFNLSIIKTGAPCLGCSFAMYIAIHDYARTNNIPYIFHGRSRAQMFGKCLPQKDKDSLPFSELYGDNEEYIDFVKNYYQWNITDRPYIGFYFYHDVSKKEMQDTIQKELNWKSTKIDGLEKKHFDCEYHEHANDMFRDKNGYDIDFYEQNYYLRMENWCGKI